MTVTAETQVNSVEQKKFSYRLKKVEIPLTMEDDDGNVKHYVLKKANGAAVAAFRNALLAGAKIQGDKIVGMGNIADAEPVLVAACLREIVYDSNGKKIQDLAVHPPTVLSWDYSIVQELFTEIKKISDLKDLMGGADNTPADKVKRLEKELAEARVELEQDNKSKAELKNS